MNALFFEVFDLVLTTALGYIVWLLKDEKKKRSANSTGTMLLLRIQMIEYHDRYCNIGEISSYAYDNFAEMYQAYKALGGNGMIEKMFEEVKELSIKDSRKETVK